MVEPRTIDDLGVETSIRWAHDQAYLDQTIMKESPFVSKQTSVDVSYPFFKSEFDLLFEIKQRHQQWANFLPPLSFGDQRMRLFTFQLAPSLGSEEFQQLQIQKIKDKVSASKKERDERKKAGRTGEYAWQDEREEEEEQKESKTLVDLLEYIQVLDKLLAAINARRSQYSKG